MLVLPKNTVKIITDDNGIVISAEAQESIDRKAKS
jgi:hypothetical protein